MVNTDQPEKYPLLVVLGQARGGKNSLTITPDGRRIPSAVFRTWADDAVRQVRLVWRHRAAIQSPCRANITYVPSDRRKRDVPALVDGLWHVLEAARVVADDALITEVHFSTWPVDRKHARIECLLEVF